MIINVGADPSPTPVGAGSSRPNICGTLQGRENPAPTKYILQNHNVFYKTEKHILADEANPIPVGAGSSRPHAGYSRHATLAEELRPDEVF